MLRNEIEMHHMRTAAVLGYNNLKNSTLAFIPQMNLNCKSSSSYLFISSLSSASESYKRKIITKPGRLKEEEEDVKRNSDIERRACSLSSLWSEKQQHASSTPLFIFFSILCFFYVLMSSLSLCSLFCR